MKEDALARLTSSLSIPGGETRIIVATERRLLVPLPEVSPEVVFEVVCSTELTTEATKGAIPFLDFLVDGRLHVKPSERVEIRWGSTKFVV